MHEKTGFLSILLESTALFLGFPLGQGNAIRSFSALVVWVIKPSTESIAAGEYVNGR